MKAKLPSGFLAEELYAMQAKRMSARAEEGRKLKHAGNRCKFQDVDTDGDGEVSAEEFAAHHAERKHHRGKQSDH